MKTVTKIGDQLVFPMQKHKLRVAAYCRVSTDSEEQLVSLATQRKHYEAYITANPDWEFAGIYYDEGISADLPAIPPIVWNWSVNYWSLPFIFILKRKT
jgi:hypothetical protein